MELISQLFCLKGKMQKENFNDHPCCQQLFGLFCFLPRSRLLFETLRPAS